MNRRLKKMLKSAYSAEPERKFSFLNQLKANPAWRKLHPISTLTVISPSVILILSTITAIAVCTGIIALNFNSSTEDEPPVPDIPPVVTQTTDSCITSVTVTSGTTAVTVSSAPPTTAPTTALLTSSAVVSMSSTATDYISTTDTDVIQSTAPPTETVPQTTVTSATSVYYTHLLRHDYTLAELSDDDTLLYGYPDSDIINKFFSAYETGEKRDIPFYIEMSLGFTKSAVIEGEITSIEYTSHNNLPVTICDVLISEVFDFYGEDVKNTGDTVKIAMYGGYMPVSEYTALNPDDTLFAEWSAVQAENTVIYEDGGNEIKPEVNDKYLFILNTATKEIGGHEVYTRLAYCDIFQFYRNGDGYICCNSATDGNFTYDSMRSLTDRNKYYFSEPDGNRKIMIKDCSELFSGIQYYYAVDGDGKVRYLDTTYTDDGFFPFRSEDDCSVVWTDSGVSIKYRTNYGQDNFTTLVLDYPK